MREYENSNLVSTEKRTEMKNIIAGLLSVIVSGCTGYPKNIAPVKNFELDRYLGRWYEIARLDHSFERGLEKVTADYSLRDDGGALVKNRGFSPADLSWKEAEGRAYFARGADEGYLKVSFFGPFYSSYVIFELDRTDYQYAFVTGPSTRYLWLLSRSPQPGAMILKRFADKAEALGFPIDELIYVAHD